MGAVEHADVAVRDGLHGPRPLRVDSPAHRCGREVPGGFIQEVGRTAERRTERALIGEYRRSIEQVLAKLAVDNHSLALEIARIPEQIKGFGHVKERNLAAARPQWDKLMRQWEQSRPERAAA